MSLPNAVRDTTEHPASNAVTAPVDRREQAADVERKLHFYGAIEAFRQGRYPSNQQIDDALKYLLDHSPVDQGKLSSDGQKIIHDCRDIIETARLIVREKNAGEIFQEFLYKTSPKQLSGVKKDPSQVLPADKTKVKDDALEAAHNIGALFHLFLTNGEFRKILFDFSVMGRDLLATAASKVAQNIRPTQEALADVDRPGPSDQFESAKGKKVGLDETPVAEFDAPATNGTIRLHPHKGVEIEREGQVLDANQAAEEARNRAQEVVGEASEIADKAADPNTDTDARKSKLRSRLQRFKDGLSDRVPQEQKKNARAKIEQGRKVLEEDFFPEDRRDQFIYRGKKVILECQKHHDYQKSIRWLLDTIEEYSRHGKHIAWDIGSTVTDDNVLHTAATQIRIILERFANGKSMDVIINAINTLIDDARSDEEFRRWFKSVGAYLRKVLLEPGYVLDPKCNPEGREVRDSGRRFYDEKYKSHFDHLFDSIGTWFKAMGEDPLVKRFSDDWARFTHALLFDHEGSLKFKPDLWMDIRKVIFPSIVDRVGYVPIPRIEYTDDALDLVVENLTLQGRNLFPNFVEIEASNSMKFSPYNTISDSGRHVFKLTLRQIQADMRDVAFYYRKKTGIPKLADSGLADVLLGGGGLNITIELAYSDKDKSSIFKVRSVRVKVHSLKFSIHGSKRDFLYRTLRPVATVLIKRQIQKAVADAIKTGMEYVDGQLVSVRDRVDEARASSDSSRTDVLRAAFQRKKEDVEEHVNVKGADRKSQFKVVAKRDSAILPKEGHPSGWATKAQESAEAAGTGESWHSNAFSIT